MVLTSAFLLDIEHSIHDSAVNWSKRFNSGVDYSITLATFSNLTLLTCGGVNDAFQSREEPVRISDLQSFWFVSILAKEWNFCWWSVWQNITVPLLNMMFALLSLPLLYYRSSICMDKTCAASFSTDFVYATGASVLTDGCSGGNHVGRDNGFSPIENCSQECV